MPYSAEHKQDTRAKIVESARILFNRHGFQKVTIDMVMENVGLTRGGFYNHFKTKEALFEAAVSGFLTGRGAQWREEAGVTNAAGPGAMAREMINGYLSPEHLGDLDGQCPMIALPTDIARANNEVRDSYQRLLHAMVGIFEARFEPEQSDARQKALSMAALCVGGMVLARTLPDSDLADELRSASQKSALELAGLN